jgi:hypothetical protein
MMGDPPPSVAIFRKASGRVQLAFSSVKHSIDGSSRRRYTTMAQFLQSYGIWIIVGALVLGMMLRRRASGGSGGCC